MRGYYIIEPILLMGREEAIKLAEVEHFVQLRLVELAPDRSRHFRIGNLGPVEALERHRRGRHVLLHGLRRRHEARQAGRRRGRRSAVQQQRGRRRRRRRLGVEALAAVHEVGEPGGRAERHVFDAVLRVVRYARAGVIQYVLELHLLLLDHLQLLAELVEVRLHVGHLLLGLQMGQRLALVLLLEPVERRVAVLLSSEWRVMRREFGEAGES